MRIKKATISISALIFVYTIFGFFIVPNIAKKKAVELINETYSTQSKVEDISFNPFSFEVEVKNFEIPDESPDSHRIKLGRLYINLEIFPLIKKEIRIKSAFLGDTTVDFKLLKTGLTNWSPKIKKNNEEKFDTEKYESNPWTLTLNLVELSNTKLTLSDFTHRDSLLLPIGPISLKAENISTSLGAKTDLESLNISFGGNGSLKLSGTSQLTPVFADVKFKAADIPLSFLSAYLSDNTILDISSGQYSGDGQIVYQDGNIKLITNSNITDLNLIQENTKVSAASWKSLQLNNLQINTHPLKVRMSELLVDRLTTGIILTKSGRLNYKEFMRQAPKDGSPNPTSAKSAIEPKQQPLDLLIDKLSLVNSKIFYSDQQIKPNFSAQISNLNGTISPITLTQNTKININLNGQIEAQGKFNALGYYMDKNKKPDLNLKMNFNNIEMTTFTPYAGKFAGYEINKGKLFLELNYTLKNRLIRGNNNAVLDQFTLGNKVESDTASNLPLKLALALLKDRDGKIKINLPVEGDIDSPEFKMSELIWTAIKNVIINIAAAPFDFLKGLLGGGNNVDSILFEPGTTNLLPEQGAKVQQLSKFLNERPNLVLEIQGRYLPSDIEALKKVTRKNEISVEQLKKLATERSQKVMSQLVELKIEAERLYLLSSGAEDKPEIGARTLLVLKNKD